MSPRYWNQANRPYNPLKNSQNACAFTGVNGVPLGGIGAGCVELLQDGRLGNFTTNNNYHRNQRIESMPGTFFAFACSDSETGGLRILSTESTLPLGPTGRQYLLKPEELAYNGQFPNAIIQYVVDNMPVRLELSAHSPLVPNDLALSCLPGAAFEFTLRNESHRPAWASVVFSWDNIAGCLHGVFPDGRDKIERFDDGKFEGLIFSSPDECRPNQKGQHALALRKMDGAVVSYARFNSWDTAPLLASIEDNGAFESDAWNRVFYADSEYAGAIAVRVELAPHGQAQVGFGLGWHYPEFTVGHSELADRDAGACDQGHYYTRHTADAKSAAIQAVNNGYGSLPGFMEAAEYTALNLRTAVSAVNSLSVLTTGTLWDREGRFSLMETPYGPMMGTLDQRFYSSIATALFFPELEKAELRLFAKTEHPDDKGRVFHDLGNLRFDDPKTGTTAKKWTDLNPKFVLMALRNYMWHNDRAEIEDLWPYIKEMMAYTLSQDSDGDCLPNNEDRSTTYDDWAFFGANSYASSIWLAALHAFRKLSAMLDHLDDWKPYETVLETATREFEERLWDEELGYYRLYNDDRNPVFALTETQRARLSADAATMADAAVNQGSVPEHVVGDHPKVNRDCHDGQLAGQWYADMLGLGPIVRPERIKSAVREIYKRNATPRGLRKGVSPEGDESPNPPSSAWWSEAGQCWPGYEVAHYAALAIYHGEVDDALASVERVYGQIADAGMTWNQPLRWNVDSGQTYGWGSDRYMNAPAIWNVLYALSGLVLDRPEGVITFRTSTQQGSMYSTLFAPGNIGAHSVLTPDGQFHIHSPHHPEPVRELWIECEDYTTGTIDGTDVAYMAESRELHGRRYVVFLFDKESAIDQWVISLSRE